MTERTSRSSIKSITPVKGGSSRTSASGSKTNTNIKIVPNDDKDEAYFTTPDFIYGGPFIGVQKPSPFIDSVTPMNIPLQGTFTRGYAYLHLKDKLPVIITQVIDDLSKKGAGSALEPITKLKNDLMTNKEFDPFTVENDETKKWNNWIESLPNKKYYNATWLFTECYVYRRLYEVCEMNDTLKAYDYFGEKKKQSFTDNLKPMCIAAPKVTEMLLGGDKDKRRADLITLLKLCLWANRCDLVLSLGEKVTVADEDGPPPPPPPPPPPDAKGKVKEPPKPPPPTSDPFQLILDLKDKVVVDDTGKIADQIVIKAENMSKALEANTVFKHKCSCHRLARSFGTQICEDLLDVPPPEPLPEGQEPPPPEELPKIPCPAKMTLPNHLMFDIVCDNAGYELFTDLCLASFMVDQKIVEMVRFHVKKIPWFVSDVTVEDFKWLLEAALNANFTGTYRLPPGPDGESEKEDITAEALNKLGKKWNSYLSNGKFVLWAEDYWTYPHGYCEMKKYDYQMYRKLQYCVGVLFKGDLNYRKLLADRCVNPYSALEPNLQGFIPAPIIAVRTVKTELICGLPKGKFDVLNKQDPKWMTTGEYGMIQFCGKAEPLKVSDRPCMDYCDNCFGVICPEHTADM